MDRRRRSWAVPNSLADGAPVRGVSSVTASCVLDAPAKRPRRWSRHVQSPQVVTLDDPAARHSPIWAGFLPPVGTDPAQIVGGKTLPGRRGEEALVTAMSSGPA
jgi:hypothetical protein